MFKIRYVIILLCSAAFLSINSCKKKNTDDPDPKTGERDSIVQNQVTWLPYTNTPWEDHNVMDVSIFKKNYYVATKGGIYKSTDGTNYSLHSAIGSTTPNVYLFALGDNFFALENQGDLHTYSGSSWSKVKLPATANLQSVEYCKMVQNVEKEVFLYIRNSNGSNQLYKSSDKGSTWTAGTMPIKAIDFAMYYPNDLVAITKTEIFHSEDKGQNWSSRSTGYSALKTIVSSPVKKEIYTFDLQDKKGYRGNLDNLTTISKLESQTLLGYSETGNLYISNITSEDNTFLQVSNSINSSFTPLATGIATISDWCIEGEEAITLSNEMVMHLNLNEQQFKSIGTPLGSVTDWQIKEKKQIILFTNTMIATSGDNGNTWLIGSGKAPEDYARCLFVDESNEKIYVGTNKGVFSTDFRGSTILEYHQHGLGANFFIASIAKQGRNVALAINRMDLGEGAIAFNGNNSLKDFTISQIEGKQTYAIHSIEIKSSVLFASLYRPNNILWYQGINTTYSGSLGSWSFNQHKEAGGNPQIYSSPSNPTGYGIVLFTNNKFLFSSTSTPIYGVYTLPTSGGDETTRLYLKDDFTAHAVIGNAIVKSTGPLATVVKL